MRRSRIRCLISGSIAVFGTWSCLHSVIGAGAVRYFVSDTSALVTPDSFCLKAIEMDTGIDSRCLTSLHVIESEKKEFGQSPTNSQTKTSTYNNKNRNLKSPRTLQNPLLHCSHSKHLQSAPARPSLHPVQYHAL